MVLAAAGPVAVVGYFLEGSWISGLLIVYVVLTVLLFWRKYRRTR
jgi:hypothetical protein